MVVCGPLPRKIRGEQNVKTDRTRRCCRDLVSDDSACHRCCRTWPQPLHGSWVYFSGSTSDMRQLSAASFMSDAPAPCARDNSSSTGAGARGAGGRSGTGICSRTGIRGMALRFPELRLALPTLELPSLVRYQRPSRMRLDGGVAPYVALPQTATGTAGLPAMGVRRVAAQPQQPQQGFRPEAAPAEEAGVSEEEELKDRCDELAEIEAELREKQQELQQRLLELNRCLETIPRRPSRDANVTPTDPWCSSDVRPSPPPAFQERQGSDADIPLLREPRIEPDEPAVETLPPPEPPRIKCTGGSCRTGTYSHREEADTGRNKMIARMLDALEGLNRTRR